MGDRGVTEGAAMADELTMNQILQQLRRGAITLRAIGRHEELVCLVHDDAELSPEFMLKLDDMGIELIRSDEVPIGFYELTWADSDLVQRALGEIER
jgi:hypothetical protein